MIYYIHIDLGKYNAVCEQYLTSYFLYKPIVLYNEGKEIRNFFPRAVVAVSWEAAKLGLSRNSTIEDAKRIPGVLIARNRYYTYELLSRFLFNCLCDYLEDISPYSNIVNATKPHLDDIVMAVDEDIPGVFDFIKKVEQWYNELGIKLSSIGISDSPRMAHFAAKLDQGIVFINQENVQEFFQLPVESFPYIKKKTSEKLNLLGIYTLGDLVNAPEEGMNKTVGEIRQALMGETPENVHSKPFRAKDHYLGHKLVKRMDENGSYYVKYNKKGIIVKILPYMPLVEGYMEYAKSEKERMGIICDLLRHNTSFELRRIARYVQLELL